MAKKKVNLDISQVLDITCRRGDSFSLVITLKDTSGTGIQLKTNKYKFIMQVKDNGTLSGREALILCTALGQPVDEKPLGTIAAMSSDGTTDGTSNIDDNGNVTVFISDSTMRQIPSGRYVYDLQYIIPEGSSDGTDTHTTVLRGAFIVNEDISEFSDARVKLR